MSGQSETPRTDNFKSQGREWLPLGIFEKAERELTQARNEVEGCHHALKQAYSIYDAAASQSDRLSVVCGELIAAIRVNSLRDTFKAATHEDIEKWLKPWIDRLAEIKESPPTSEKI